MTEELENELRRALRRVESSDDFTERLREALRRMEPQAGMTERLRRALHERRMPAASPTVAETRAVAPAGRWQRFGGTAALAASLVLAVFLGQDLAERRFERERRAGLAASHELMQALRVTSQKLDLAYQAVHNEPPPPQPVGAGENRS
jgi:hypothetical protein